MKTFKLSVLFIIAFLMIACDTEDDSADNELEIKQFISVDPANPLLLRLERSDDIIISYYGEKDNLGRALNCNLVGVKYPQLDKPIYTEIDEAGRPSKVFASDGSSIKFNYDDLNDVRVSVVTAQGQNRLSFPLSTFQDQNRKPQNSSSIRSGKKLKLIETTPTDASQNRAACNISNLQVNLQQCEEPFNNASILLLAKGVDDPDYQAQYYANSNGNGSYCFNVKQPQPSAIQVDEICFSVESVLGTLCDGLQFLNAIPGGQITLCVAISSAFTAASLQVFTGCEILINSLNIYCNTLGASPAPGVPSVLAAMCDSEALDENIPTQFTFKPAIYIDGGSTIVGAETNEYPTSGPFDDINIAIPEEPKVKDFYTNPFDPSPEQDYIATAELNCILDGMIATISVVGTDGYTDSITVTLPQGNSTISLSVPGAEGGIKDILTVDIHGFSTLNNIIFF